MKTITTGLMLCVACLCLPQVCWAQLDDDEVDFLIGELGAQSYGTRERATKQLLDHLKSINSTPAQRAKVRAAAEDDDNLEIQHRAEKILSAYNQCLDSVQTVLHSIKVELVRTELPAPFPGAGGRTHYTFDGWDGETVNVAWGIGGGLFALSDPFFDALSTRYEKVRSAIGAGDVPAARTALTEFKNFFVNDVGNTVDFFEFGLVEAGTGGIGAVEATKQEVIDKLDEALQELDNVEGDLAANIGPDIPGAPKKIAVDAPGPLDTGQSLRVVLENVVQTGEIDVFMPMYENALALPPEGFHYVGNIFEIDAGDVEVEGIVDVALEFGLGSEEKLGLSVNPARELQMVRIANGNIDFLPTVVDPITQTAQAGYIVEPLLNNGPFSFEQFGTFALVQTPEPSTAVLSLIASLWMFHARRRGV